MSEVADVLLAAIRDAQPGATDPTILATVQTVTTSGVTVTFDGEAVASSRAYRRLTDVEVGQRVVMLRVGTTWVVAAPVVPRVLRSGLVSLTFPAGSRSTGAILTFPVPFSAAPVVVVSAQDPRFVAGAYNITTAQCTIDSYFEGTSVGASPYPLTVSWLAHGLA